jgi:hypothetical protein
MANEFYERWENESDKAYEAFSIYRDMGISRSIDNVVQKLNKSRQLISRWSGQYAWVQRAAAYDDHIDQLARKKLEREAVNRKVEMLRRHGMAGRLMQRKAAEYLDKHGMEKSADAINGMQKGIAIERAAEGLPEYLLEVVNADDNELARQYHALLAEIGGFGSGDEEAGNADPGTETAAQSPADPAATD